MCICINNKKGNNQSLQYFADYNLEAVIINVKVLKFDLFFPKL